MADTDTIRYGYKSLNKGNLGKNLKKHYQLFDFEIMNAFKHRCY